MCFSFQERSDLDKHVARQHTNRSKESQWNCNDCDFQGNEASELINHLKVTGHQPSKSMEKRKSFKEYKQCYTCKMEFDGYYNLMDHRKNVHPSKKECRNFPANCTFGNECWYVHQEPMDVDEAPDITESSWNFKCNICDEQIKERRDFMKHKKNKHADSILNCENFLKGKCSRNEETCWFKHTPAGVDENPKATKQQVFQKVSANPFPPDQLSQMFQMINNLCTKMGIMEKKFQELIE